MTELLRGKGKELAARWASLWTGGKRLGASLSQRIDYILRDASCLNYLRIPHIGKDLGRKGVDGSWLGSYQTLDPGLVVLNLHANTRKLLLKVLLFLL